MLEPCECGEMVSVRSGGRAQAVFQAVVMLFVVLGLTSMIVSLAFIVPGAESFASSHPWLLGSVSGASIFLTSFLLIRFISRGKTNEHGFNMKGRDLKVRRSVWVGALFAFAMALIDYVPPLLGGSFELDYQPTLFNVLGRLSYTWVFLGVAEETLFRGLIQTQLTRASMGYVNILRWRLRWGTTAAAAIYGLSHFVNLASKPLTFVLPQVGYTIFLGLAIGYLYQETRSLVGPIVAHNVANGLEYTIEFILFTVVS